MNISFSIKKIIHSLTIFTICLTVANCLVLFSKLYLGYDYLLGFVRLFNFYSESNIPTWFSSILLFTASVLLLIVAFIKKKTDKEVLYWCGLFVIFILLSLDEVAQLHEMTGGIIRRFSDVDFTGAFRSPWVIVGGIAFTVFALTYVKFLFNLPRKIRNLFFISGIFYVGGALGFEVMENFFISSTPEGFNTLEFAIMVTLEELLEMLGIIVFIYSILLYIVSFIGPLSINFDS